MRHWVLPDCTCWWSPIASSSWWGHRRLRFTLVAGELLCFQFTVRLDLQCLTRLIYFLFGEARRSRHTVKCLPTCSPGECCWCLSRTVDVVAFWKVVDWGWYNLMWPQCTRQNFSISLYTGLDPLFCEGLRGKPSITYRMCKLWITWCFVIFFWRRFL